MPLWTRPQSFLPRRTALAHFHGAPYLDRTLPMMPPTADIRMLAAVWTHAPMSPWVRHSMPAVMPSSSETILMKSLAIEASRLTIDCIAERFAAAAAAAARAALAAAWAHA